MSFTEILPPLFKLYPTKSLEVPGLSNSTQRQSLMDQEFKKAGDLLQRLRIGLKIAISFGICGNFYFWEFKSLLWSLASVFKCTSHRLSLCIFTEGWGWCLTHLSTAGGWPAQPWEHTEQIPEERMPLGWRSLVQEGIGHSLLRARPFLSRC